MDPFEYKTPGELNEEAALWRAAVALALCALVGGGIAVYGPVLLRPQREPFEQRLDADTGKRDRFVVGASAGFILCGLVLGLRFMREDPHAK